MKKTLLLIAVLTLFCVSLFASGSADVNTDRLSQIKSKGYMEVATEPYFAPYEFIDPSKSGDDKYIGLDMELAKAIANEIGVELRIVPLEFTAVQTGVASGKYDLAISAIAYSPARAEAMTLSRGYQYMETGYGFIVRTEDAGKYNSIEDLKNAVVITQSGSVQEGIYTAYVPACKEFKRTSAMTDAYLAVQEGKADVCICSTASAQLYADANGGKLSVPSFRFTVDPEMNGVVCAAPQTGSKELIELVNKVITANIDNGNIEKWYNESASAAKELGLD